MGQEDLQDTDLAKTNAVRSNPFSADNLILDSNPKPILVAEDNIVNQKIAIILLEKLGLTAHVVNNGIEAVKAVSSHDYPVVLMDCHMPEMDGFEATKEIRRLEASTGKHTAIIAVTALSMAGDRQRCIDAGMDDYISKPIDKERLKNKLTQWMRKEFVFHNQKLAERFFEANSHSALGPDPIDLAELEVFYGSSEEVEEVLGLFVNITQKQLPELGSALSNQQSQQAAAMSHELKGSSASVGAKEMSLLCLQLEQQIGQQDWERTNQTFINLTKCFDSVRKFVARSFQKTNAQRS